jgi:hypothetical protein
VLNPAVTSGATFVNEPAGESALGGPSVTPFASQVWEVVGGGIVADTG